MLDRVVQQYLADDDLGAQAPFGERALGLVRGYKRDLDRNRAACGCRQLRSGLSPEVDPGPARIGRAPRKSVLSAPTVLFHARAREYQTASSLARWMGAPPRRASA